MDEGAYTRNKKPFCCIKVKENTGGRNEFSFGIYDTKDQNWGHYNYGSCGKRKKFS
jgi:hypothetical protein